MLYAVLEEAERAIYKIEQYSQTISLHVFACFIVARLAVAKDGTIVSADEPAVGAFVP
jgi:hypothetical protein